MLTDKPSGTGLASTGASEAPWRAMWRGSSGPPRLRRLDSRNVDQAAWA